LAEAFQNTKNLNFLKQLSVTFRLKFFSIPVKIDKSVVLALSLLLQLAPRIFLCSQICTKSKLRLCKRWVKHTVNAYKRNKPLHSTFQGFIY